jgi:hypothetical protein
MLTATIERPKWVVSFGCYKVVGDKVLIHLWETILTLGATMPMVKVMIVRGNMMKDINNLDTNLQPSETAPSSMFIYLYSLSFGEDAPSEVQV